MQNQAPPRPLDSTGVKVLLAILASLPLWRRDGDTDLRITDRPDGVLVEAVGYLTNAEATGLVHQAALAAIDAGLGVAPTPGPLGVTIGPARLLVRRPS